MQGFRLAVLVVACALPFTHVHAQRASEALLEEVLVTAQKKSSAEEIQDTSIAITAYGADQLEALKVRDLKGLSYSMPNVALEDVGTTKGTANFAIRGLGVNSSIPSIDPTVGVFVDGMYLGINGGVVFDMFDLEGIEVLRGPQGVLFGRNVTGGAVLVRTRLPGEEFVGSAKFAVETGLNRYYSASVSGPMTDKLKAKLAVYLNEDEGWHDNEFGDDSHGDARTRLIRPVFVIDLDEYSDLILRFERGDAEGDGPAAQNRGRFDRDDFKFSINETGYFDNYWNQGIVEYARDVDFLEGRITNIAGFRHYNSQGVSDIDASSSTLFHAGFETQQEQVSNEFRFNGRIGEVIDLTAGLYYFDQEVKYQENRQVTAGIPGIFAYFYGGGIQDHDTWGAFASVDYLLSEKLTLTAGWRFSQESKDAKIRTLERNLIGPNMQPDEIPPGQCDVIGGDCAFDFKDDKSWSNITPKVGVTWTPNDQMQIYSFLTKGFRSGGYNLRNTDPSFSPGPFDEETQNSFEVGVKYDSPDNRARLNVAAFYNQIKDMQREVNLPSGGSGVVQIIRNTADAEIMGVELEGRYAVLPNLIVNLSVGYVEGEYREVKFDLNGDNVVNGQDGELDLPRLAPLTGSLGIIYDQNVGDFGFITAQASYSHRDEAAYTDNNRGTLNDANMVDATISLSPNSEAWTVSVYGKNLRDEATEGGDTQLPFGALGVTSFSPLNKGRVVGAEFKVRF
ncbi:iron complex outermembrane receptor protein [Litorivivens lipolytica]|uniref:Iron complex outermembrane receptor protein n=1 Tax=Litorivivens lipolytica TaxID=1524264 RepID=A0A7W4Z5Z9_9GAMM|nr:TonB-dependent receptor [Litorivivens lipolytica]MBB3047657.1 iron complex outermembrane receptor protein [Litorivivens lipolytica]